MAKESNCDNIIFRRLVLGIFLTTWICFILSQNLKADVDSVIIGDVYIDEGIPSALVELVSSSTGETIALTISGYLGDYLFGPVPYGSYMVRAYFPNSTIYVSKSVNANSSVEVVNLEFSRVPTLVEKPYFFLSNHSTVHFLNLLDDTLNKIDLNYPIIGRLSKYQNCRAGTGYDLDFNHNVGVPTTNVAWCSSYYPGISPLGPGIGQTLKKAVAVKDYCLGDDLYEFVHYKAPPSKNPYYNIDYKNAYQDQENVGPIIIDSSKAHSFASIFTSGGRTGEPFITVQYKIRCRNGCLNNRCL